MARRRLKFDKDASLAAIAQAAEHNFIRIRAHHARQCSLNDRHGRTGQAITIERG
jgi:hypothetical protein